MPLWIGAVIKSYMKKITYLFVFIICFSVFAETKKPLSFDIQGLSDLVLVNVENRLIELEELKPLNEYEPDELIEQIVGAMRPFGYGDLQAS
jgi:translocation and assembly module TamA